MEVGSGRWAQTGVWTRETGRGIERVLGMDSERERGLKKRAEDRGKKKRTSET